MSHAPAGPPDASEYGAFYSGYVALVPDEPILHVLQSGIHVTSALLRELGEGKLGYRYADGKWSVAESVVHLIDAERIWAYRALRIARGDQTPLAGFEQDDYVAQSPAARYSIEHLILEYEAVRRASVLLLEPLVGEEWLRRGVANKAEISVRALAFLMAGHEIHHRKILHEKYR